MSFAKTLSRDEMKNVMAGYVAVGHMCCWNGTNNCSGCVEGPSGPCVEGAEKRVC
jgi:hypothetical protein